jgi:hypothetical protein
MSPQPIHSSVSPLRRRMLEDMAMRGLPEETQRDYIRFVRSFAAFLGAAAGVTRPRAVCNRQPSPARCRRCASSSP